MNRPPAAQWALAVMPVASLAASRLPSERPWEAVTTVGLALYLIAVSVLRIRGVPMKSLAPLNAWAVVGLLLVPASANATLASLPVPAQGVLAVLLMHLLLGDTASQAPEAASTGKARTGLLRASVPLALAVAWVTLAPLWLLVLLPERLAASVELQGPFGVVFAALPAIAILLSAASVRRLMPQPRALPSPDVVNIK